VPGADGDYNAAGRRGPGAGLWDGFCRIVGVSDAIIKVALNSHVPLLLLAWLLAALMRWLRVGYGVAMSTAARIVAPIALHATGFIRSCWPLTGAGSADFFSRERRRVLAGEGVLQHELAQTIKRPGRVRNNYFRYLR